MSLCRSSVPAFEASIPGVGIHGKGDMLLPVGYEKSLALITGWINEKGEKVTTLTEHEKYLLRKQHEKSEDKRMKVGDL